MSTAKHKPWQRRSRRPRLPDIIIRAITPPHAVIQVYDNLVVLTRRDGRGCWRQYPVAPHALATTLAKVPQATGLLPQHTLGCGIVYGQAYTVVYVPPRRVTLSLSNKQTFVLMTPPLVWSGCGSDYRIFALATTEYPQRTNLPLYKAPFPNCYTNGSICWGDAERPGAAQPASLLTTLDHFLQGSRFNLHLADGKSVAKPRSVAALWATLTPETAYPLDDLMPAQYQLSWLLSGAAWQGEHTR